MDPLYVAVQSLVDHDRELTRLKHQRSEKVKVVTDLMKGMGHFPCNETDPIIFRCGDVVCTVPNEWNVKWEIIKALEVNDAN